MNTSGGGAASQSLQVLDRLPGQFWVGDDGGLDALHGVGGVDGGGRFRWPFLSENVSDEGPNHAVS